MQNTEETKKVFRWVWVVLVILAVFLAVETLGSLKNLKDTGPANNTISVTGEGEAFAIPDVATFNFTVSADAASVSAAQSQVTERMDTILAGLTDMGIEERDIKTTNYSVWPKYVYDQAICTNSFCPPSRQRQDGYTANHSVSIKVRNTESAGEALALAGEGGATGLSGISFTLDDPDKVIEEARAAAIEDARGKAETLSESLGVKLVRVVSFQDSTGNGVIPYLSESRDLVQTAGAPAPTIPIGEDKTEITVTVVYEIR